MEFWDEVYKKVSSAASYTAKETGRVTELAKVKFNLMREKSRLEDSYKELGEIYYKQMKDGELNEKEASLAYDKIEKSIEEIERINAQITVLSNTKVCCVCGTKIEKDMEYCFKCGAEQTKKENTEEE